MNDESTFSLFNLLAQPTRADQIEKAWRTFHSTNPLIWRLYQQFTMDLICAGHEHGSSDMVLHRIRWETAVKTVSPVPLKINNNFSSLYSRLSAQSYPEHSEFFLTRKRISENKPAYDVDIQLHDGGPPGNEAGLNHRLTEIAFQHSPNFHRP
jgi:hypothetical protein